MTSASPSPVCKRHAVSRFVRRLVAVGAGVVLAAGLAEVAVRAGPWPLPPGIRGTVSLHDLREVTEHHERLGYVMLPGLTDRQLATTDFAVFRASTRAVPGAPDQSVGFRDEFDLETAWGVLVGDSFAFGWGVDEGDTFVARTERALGATILNLGVAGWGPQQALTVLEDYGLRYRPEVVVWAFYPNDFDDAYDFAGRDRSERYFVRKSPFHLGLNRFSAVYKLYRYLAAPRSSNAVAWSDGDLTYVFTHQWQGMLNPDDPVVRAGRSIVAGVLTRAAALAAEHGFRVVLMAVPYREQVYYEEYAAASDRVVMPRDHLETAYHDVLATAANLGMFTLDVQPALRRHKAEQIYFPHDCHLTARGNEIVGEQLTGFIRRQGWRR